MCLTKKLYIFAMVFTRVKFLTKRLLTDYLFKNSYLVMQYEIFKFQSAEEQTFSEVRTLEIDGKIYFCATDVAKVLGYVNPRDAIVRHCKPGGVVIHDTLTNSGVQPMKFINEGNVYRLIVRSALPSAEKFEKWLFEEVVPSIHSKGYYGNVNRATLPNFTKRYIDNVHSIPSGYFSVITELFVRMHALLEKAGYVIPDKGVHGKQMMPDISVGRGFAQFLKRNNSEYYDTHKTYKHKFPDGRIIDANMYSIDALPVFIRYIEEDWLMNCAQAYFKDKDPMALDYLPKIIAPRRIA